MLILLFKAGEQLYGFDVRGVVEVVPRVELRSIPHAPSPVAGLLAYRGGLVPVIDFNLLVGLECAPPLLSTRIVVTEFEVPGEGRRRLGVVAERAGEVVRGAPGEQLTDGLHIAEAPYLDELYQTSSGLVQVVRPSELLPECLRESLLAPTPGAS